MSIIPGTELITFYKNGTSTSDVKFQLDHFNSRLIIYSSPLPDSIVISYKVFPYLLTKKYYNKDVEALEQADILLKPYTVPSKQTNPYLDIDGLNYNGSLTRGISFGNNQDVVVNSSFNLQMSGKLQNDVEIQAAITESNIPIQPEGNTQQLQDFDKVFIRLSKNEQALTVGDYELTKPESYFLNFYKNSQGALYEGTFQHVFKGSLKTQAGLAVAKGIYTRQQISILEGNQGPYKLYGVNNETFIIILAGTERVFIDGKLLTRGAENDYTIDYNASEITFTTNQILTKDKRVEIEFEYSDKNYFRSLAYLKNTYQSADDKLHLRLHLYSEQDSKNQPVDQTIDSLGRSTLENIGDSIQQAYFSSLDTIGFDASRIMYKMIDTLGYDSVFVYSTNADSAKYVMVFSQVGQNKGNYIQTISTANGRVYQWVAPLAGVPQGYAEPVILLIAPKKNQMLTLGGDYHLNSQNIISGEIAYSKKDMNTFSDIDNSDNDGIGFLTGYQNILRIDSSISLLSKISYEYTAETFSTVERYRPLEFNRDWNIFSENAATEHYTNASFNLTGIKNLMLSVNSSSFIRQEEYMGFRQSISSTYFTKTWNLKLDGSLLNSKADTVHTQFLRPRIEISRTFPVLKSWKSGVIYDGEKNMLFADKDSINAGSFLYNQYEAYIQNADTAINKFGLHVIYRDDKLADSGKLSQLTEGLTYLLTGALNKKESNKLSWQLTYRTLEITDTSLTDLKNENSLLGRLQHTYIYKKGFFTSDIFYEIGTGQEPKREYAFIEVEPGLGLYTWMDYNANGIPELDEFEIAVFTDEANYIQVYVPSNEYVQSNTTNFNYTLALNPKALWFNSSGIKKVLSKFSAQSALQLNKKVFDKGSFHAYNPFYKTEDSLLVSSSVYFLNTLFFNRSSSIFGADYSYQETSSTTLIVNGPESRSKQEHKLQVRYKLAQSFTLNTIAQSGTKLLNSEAFPDKNYRIPYFIIEPKLTYIPGQQFRISALYQFTSSANKGEIETLKSNEAALDIKYNVVSKSTISSKISYVKIQYTGVEESPVGYAMLEGLENGNNILWSLSLDRKLSQILQLNLTYEGRKTGDADITHIGRVQMRAVF